MRTGYRLALTARAAGVMFVLWCFKANAGDWPQWRYDASRTAASPDELPAGLHLQWVRAYPALEPAWEDPVNRDRMPYDRLYEPVVAGTRLFFGSSLNDSVTALDTRTGKEVWRFYADGPVRLPPVAHNGRVYCVSDDGYLYCLAGDTGALVWKFRGGPSARKILGNSRLVSVWTARGGPVVADNTVYFAAGIWPFEGVFIHALDAETGAVRWTNDGASETFMDQPHPGAAGFGGVAPQGALVALGDDLLVPGGRTVPACFDRKTGKLRYFHLAGSTMAGKTIGDLRKLEGGSHVSGIGQHFFNHRGTGTCMYDVNNGDMRLIWKTTTYPVLTPDTCYLSGNPVQACPFRSLRRQGNSWKMPPAWECNVAGSAGLIKAGSCLYAGGRNVVSALRLVGMNAPEVVWQAPVDGTAERLVAADNRLFVVTPKGRIYAFGAEDHGAVAAVGQDVLPSDPPKQTRALAAGLVKTLPVRKGYVLVYAPRDTALLEAIAAESELRTIAVDPDRQKVDQLRRDLDAKGLYGTRVAVHVGRPVGFQAPPYLAALTVIDDLDAAGFDGSRSFVQTIYESVRPYGGLALFRSNTASQQADLAALIEGCALPGAKVSHGGSFVLFRREGALPGSADWTHLYGDVANTAKSDDKLVKLPLGLLWFGGSTHEDVLPRHGHGPTELVVDGRLLIEGINVLNARDVFTGQVLWQHTFEDLGTYGVYYDKSFVPNPLDQTRNQQHIAGANARGANYAAAHDRVYLVAHADCEVLDPSTGKTLTTFSLPPESAGGPKPEWGYVGIYKNFLIAGAGAVKFSQLTGGKATLWNNFDTSSSRRLVVMDRHTGKVRWTRKSENAFRHNAIAVGDGKVFCIDATPKPVLSALMRGNRTHVETPRLLALDVATGEPVWENDDAVFGTWLSYSKERDLLIQCGRAARDMIKGESSNRLNALRGATGKIVWDTELSHSGPVMLHGDTIYLNAEKTSGAAIELLTGKPKTWKNPLTGEEMPWKYDRFYGCNSSVCGEYLLAFRSGAAGFYDIERNGGTGNLGGFKSGCSANLIAADGVLNAPDYTRTCTCAYQNQTSLALVHRPDVEMWTFNDFKWDGRPVRRIGINLGAPGDRRDDNGTLWLDYPSVGGASPDLPVSIEASPARYFRHHSSRLSGDMLTWVGASGVDNVKKLTLTISQQGSTQGATSRIRVADGADDAEETAGKVNLTSTDLELVTDRNKKQLIGIRFSHVGVSPGQRIENAHIQFTVDEASAAPTELWFYGQAAPTPPPFGGGPKRLSVRKRTAATVAWTPPPWNTVGAAGPTQESPDLSSIVQEVVSQTGWKRGNSMVFLIDGKGKRVAKSYNGDPDGAPLLVISGKGEGAATPDTQPRLYNVRLVFADPIESKPGKRVFDVAIQGKTVLSNFDIAETAGGANKVVVRTFRGIAADAEITVAFTPRVGEPLLCGIEVVAQ